MKGLEGHFHVKFSREISLENGPPELSYIIEVDPLDSNMHSHCDESLYVWLVDDDGGKIIKNSI